MNSNTTIFIVIAALLIAGGLAWFFTSPDPVIMTEPVGNGNETPQLTQAQRETIVENEIRENISALSPEDEVLGGTFYVTDIQFTGSNSGVVEYEDGHIALVADFTYSFDIDNRPQITLSNVTEAMPN